MLGSLGKALTGLRVLDLSRVLAGPFCTQILGDLGADVIKVEDPSGGDETRSWGTPYLSGLSDYFLACNRNKKSLALDLKKPEGPALLKQLISRSDVLIENFRADSRTRLGLGATDLHALNPQLVIATISGFGPDDPKHRPGYDYVIQGMSGMMAMNGPAAGDPYKFGVAIADILTGLYASTGILAALHARQKSGEGYAFDVSLLDCAVAAQANVVQSFLCSGRQPKKQGHAHLQIVPYQLFAAADGFLILAIGNDKQWRRFCIAANTDDLASDSRFRTNRSRVENREVLVPLIAARIKAKPLSYWQVDSNPPMFRTARYGHLTCSKAVTRRVADCELRPRRRRGRLFIWRGRLCAGITTRQSYPQPWVNIRKRYCGRFLVSISGRSPACAPTEW